LGLARNQLNPAVQVIVVIRNLKFDILYLNEQWHAALYF
jgi:hypothetical protein